MEEKPILEVGKAKRGIQSPEILKRSLRVVHSAGERMTCRNYADRDEKLGKSLKAFSAQGAASSKRPANKCASAVPHCIRYISESRGLERMA
jgi:hypothetical protein